MKNKILVLIIFVCAPFLAISQYLGPNVEHNFLTVQEMNKDSKSLLKSKTLVKTKGFVIRKLDSRHRYIFADVTGKIEIELEPRDLPHVSFDDENKVLILGYMKVKSGRSYIEVSKIIVLRETPQEAVPATEIAPITEKKEDANIMTIEEELMDEVQEVEGDDQEIEIEEENVPDPEEK